MSVIEAARAKRADLRTELAKVEQFIADYEQFEGTYTRRQNRTFVRGHNADVLDQIIAVLTAASPDRVRTADIAARIAGTGFSIVAKSPAAYVGTIIHRNQDKIDRTPDGSRLRGVAS